MVFHNTASFLVKLAAACSLPSANCPVGFADMGESDLLGHLQGTLQQDGFAIVPLGNASTAVSAAMTAETPVRVGRFLESVTRVPVDSPEFGLYMGLSILCLMCAALGAGLTQGMISLEPLEMAIKLRSGTPEEKAHANKLLPLITQHHFLLVTLLLFNAIANEVLPLFFDEIFPSYIAILLSVTGVLLFGEIIPSAIMTGPKQMQITATLAPFTWTLMAVLSPVAYPLSKLLDLILGHDDGMTMYSRGEMAAMVRIQHEEGAKRGSLVGMNKDEMQMIAGVLRFRDLKASEVMTSAYNAYMLPLEGKLDTVTMGEIFKAGYSRVPIYANGDRNNVVSLLLAKDLIFLDPEDAIPISNFITLFGRTPSFVWHDELLPEVLAVFRKSRGHLALVRDVVCEGAKDPTYAVVGVVTLEDIVQEILGQEIADEYDDVILDEFDDRARVVEVNNRDVGFARLRMLNPDVKGELMSAEEARTVATHLKANVPQVSLLLAEVLGYIAVAPATTAVSAEGEAPAAAADAADRVNELLDLPLGADVSSSSASSSSSSSVSAPGTATCGGGTEAIYDVSRVTIEDITRLLMACPVIDLARKTDAATLAMSSGLGGSVETLHPDDFLYRRGKVAYACTVILNGRVTVLAGKEAFRAEVTAWTAIGSDALVPAAAGGDNHSGAGGYVPDFSAFITSDTLRCVRISLDSAKALLAAPTVRKGPSFDGGSPVPVTGVSGHLARHRTTSENATKGAAGASPSNTFHHGTLRKMNSGASRTMYINHTRNPLFGVVTGDSEGNGQSSNRRVGDGAATAGGNAAVRRVSSASHMAAEESSSESSDTGGNTKPLVRGHGNSRARSTDHREPSPRGRSSGNRNVFVRGPKLGSNPQQQQQRIMRAKNTSVMDVGGAGHGAGMVLFVPDEEMGGSSGIGGGSGGGSTYTRNPLLNPQQQ